MQQQSPRFEQRSAGLIFRWDYRTAATAGAHGFSAGGVFVDPRIPSLVAWSHQQENTSSLWLLVVVLVSPGPDDRQVAVTGPACKCGVFRHAPRSLDHD